MATFPSKGLVVMGGSGTEVHRVGVVWHCGALTIDLVLKWALRNRIGNFDSLVIHPFPNHLEGLFPFDPLLNDNDTMTRQDSKNNLTRVIWILKSDGTRE